MASRSVNGLPVISTNRTTGSMPRLRKWYVPKSETLGYHERYFYLRDGCVGFVLMHFILWFHEKVEHLDVTRIWDEWGWAVRPVRGQTSGYSNHASGSAGDVNATRHPRGVSIWRTFRLWQIKLIRSKILDPIYRNCLTWGGDWNTPDGMHVEIRDGVSIARVNRVAKRLMRTKRGKRILHANPGAKAVILS